MQNTSALYKITHRPPPTIKLPRMQYIKQALENYRFCRNSGNDTDANGKKGKGGVGGGRVILFASL